MPESKILRNVVPRIKLDQSIIFIWEPDSYKNKKCQPVDTDLIAIDFLADRINKLSLIYVLLTQTLCLTLCNTVAFSLVPGSDTYNPSSI